MDRVYVANLPPDIRIKDIDDFFSPFGKLVFIDVNNRSNPVYAYVQFDNARNAFNAVKARHGYDYEGYTLQLRLIENEVRKRRDPTPPPPPPPMLSNFGRQNLDSGFRNNMGNSRMGENFSNYPIDRNTNTMFERNTSSSSQAKPNFMFDRNTNSSFQGRTNGSSSSNSNFDWSNNNHSGMTSNENMIQYPTNSRFNTSQQNMNYPVNRQQNMMQSGNDRSNMPQQSYNTNSSNMRQQFSNIDRADMPQQYNSNRSNMQQDYSNLTNMSRQNNSYGNRSDMSQQNDMFSSNALSNIQQLYSDTNYSNMPQHQQRNMMNYCENNGNNSMNWNNMNDANSYNNNFGNNEIYNPNNPDAQKILEDTFTRGLSGSGRKWFNRYIRQGLSPEMARAKALEHRTVPYLRDDPKNIHHRIAGNNAALETVGNTIMSLLNNQSGGNSQQGYVDRRGGINEKPVPLSSLTLQPPNNVISKRQYLRSIDALKILQRKRVTSAQDRISKKNHLEIIRNYERLVKKSSNTPSARDVGNGKSKISSVPKDKLEDLLRKKKGELLKSSKSLQIEQESKKRFGGAYKKRVKILMYEAGFPDLEARSLALHPLEKLEGLMALKKEYDMLNLKTDFIPANKKTLKETPKEVVYRNDMKYLNTYKEHRVSSLSPRIVTALKECIVRIHNYEKEQKLPITGSKFINLVRKINLTQKKPSAKPATSNAKKDKNTPGKKNDEEKNIKETKAMDEKREVKKEDGEKKVGNEDDQENENATEDNQCNEVVTEDNEDVENVAEDDQGDEENQEQNDDNEEEFEDDANLENGVDEDQNEEE